MEVMRVVYIWSIRMDVYNKKMGGFLINFLDTISEVCSMRYFIAQHITPCMITILFKWREMRILELATKMALGTLQGWSCRRQGP